MGEAASLLGVSVDTVRRWADDGRLKTTRTGGGHRLVDAPDLARLAKVRRSTDLATIHYVRQGDPLGLGHAVLCAAEHVGREPFAVLLGDDLIDVLTEHAFSCSSPRSYAAMFHLKGAVSRVAEGKTAFGNRQASHAITLDAVWRPGEEFGDREIAWSRRFFDALGGFREGVYVNFLGGDEDQGRVREAYGDAVYNRLAEMKIDWSTVVERLTS